MSTALQTAPHQPPTLATSPLVPSSTSGLQYPSDPYQEGHYANQQTASPRPSSSKRASRSRGGSDGANTPSAAAPPNQPQSASHDMTPRTAVANPAPVSAPEYQSHNPERRRNMPPVAPPRTSSNQDRRTAHSNERSAAPPRQSRHSDAPRNGNMEDPAMDDARASSRRHYQQMPQEPPPRASSSRDHRASGTASVSSRAAAPVQPSGQDADDVAFLDAAAPPVVGTGDYGDQARRGGRSRHDHRANKRDKETKFSEYILGNAIGEGEFGKVRLGWKQDDRVQVAIKIIKKESLGNNPSRLAKIHREVNILRGLSHPNIVHLHDMIGDDSRIGIVLEYASGGELFDYILNHRYLKDNAARRLFAQLISGVGYLHKKGIVHRDLKLENLLLDRHRNIIITDFGFANIFDPRDELTEEEEMNLSDREFIKRRGLDKLSKGIRRGDLMQTSCGSPCYAAPELVVSDSVYTGRKVDVWSCGVILYAMLAGYLPFDDDPANPEGDNINLLYKYIVHTPLTFPEYVSPHARDLLRRILVPNPRKRADLFEVARHSWLSEYANVVRVITSSTTTPIEIQNTTVPAEEEAGSAGVTRSASVREATKPKSGGAPSTVGGLATKQGNIDAEEAAAAAKTPKDAKRRTVQVEYVAPTTQTQRGEYAGAGKSRTRGEGPVEAQRVVSREKPLPRDPPVTKDPYGKPSSRQTADSNRHHLHHQQQAVQDSPEARPSRDRPENIYVPNAAAVPGGPPSSVRPPTEGSIQSGASMGFTAAGRGTYGQPVPPSMASTNAQGRIQQPSSEGQDPAHPNVPPKFSMVSGHPPEDTMPPPADARGHKRSSTIGDIGSKLLGRSGSIFGKGRKRTDTVGEKGDKKYPPLSMANARLGDEVRQSVDSRHSRRSFSIGLGRKRSGSVGGSQGSGERQSRRFSFIPSISKAIGLGEKQSHSQQSLPIQSPGRNGAAAGPTPIYDQMHGAKPAEERLYQSQPQLQTQAGGYGPAAHERRPNAVPEYMQQQSVLDTGSESSGDSVGRQGYRGAGSPYHERAPQPEGDGRRVGNGNGAGKGGRVLQKTKRFADAYEEGGREGSSGAARRVMDFFRRRGKARGGEER